MIIQEWTRFSNLGKRPKLQQKTVPYYVDDALSQPAYVDAGSYLIHNMLEENVIRPIKGGCYVFVRMTPAKRDHMDRIPRAVNALFNIYRRMKEDGEPFSGMGQVDLAMEQLFSVAVALDKVVVRNGETS